MSIRTHSLKGISLVSGFCLIASLACAQNNTNSPLSIFGLGEIETRDLGNTSGMGNVGIGVKSYNFLNRRNPAGLSGIDTLKFVLDVSVGLKVSDLSTDLYNQHSTTFNFKNMTAGFRISKRWTSCVGLSPYSNVGYNTAKEQQIEGTNSIYNTIFTGDGGINRVYWGNSLEIFKGLTIGAKASYFFGTITHKESAPSITISETMTASKVYFDFGVQYSHLFASNMRLTVGGVYGYRTNFNMYQKQTLTQGASVMKEQAIPDKKNYLPESFGGGISLYSARHEGEWLVALDYYQQNWSVNKDRLRGLAFTDSRICSAGLQWIPNIKHPANYFHIMRYQIGACYNESYLSIHGHQVKDYSVTAGLGLPFFRGSIVNVAVSAGRSGTGQRGGITENYVLLSLNLSLIEQWFARRLED